MTAKEPGPPQPVPPFDWAVLARYLADESSAPEAEAVRRWLAEDPARAQLLHALAAPIARLRQTPPAGLDVESALHRVHTRMSAPSLQILPAHTTGSRRLLGLGWAPVLRAAAVVAVLAGGALIARQLRRGGAVQPPAGTAVARATLYRTGVGQRDSVTLADGTRVLLGPGSALTVAANFPVARTVTLEGEALFDVRHDASNPFTVRAGRALVQDVGTRFVVVGDAGGRVRVAVTAGVVRLSSTAATPGAGESVLLRAGQAGLVEPDGQARTEPSADTPAELAWTRGELVFRGAPLSEVAAALRRWYGVELRVTDPALARRHLTTAFAGESRDRVLQVIALALGGRIELRGDTAILSPGRGAAGGE